MDYTTLYDAWKREKQDNDLQHLDKRFYVELSEHIRVHREENQMLDDKTLRAKLNTEEMTRIGKLLIDLIWTRYRKIIEATYSGKSISTNLLTSEEEIIFKDILSTFERIKNLEKNVLSGSFPRLREAKNVEKPKRTLVVRFLKEIPAIVGSNMKVYGPFKIEDVASLPVENAESLIKRGVAVRVDVK